MPHPHRPLRPVRISTNLRFPLNPGFYRDSELVNTYFSASLFTGRRARYSLGSGSLLISVLAHIYRSADGPHLPWCRWLGCRGVGLYVGLDLAQWRVVGSQVVVCVCVGGCWWRMWSSGKEARPLSSPSLYGARGPEEVE